MVEQVQKWRDSFGGLWNSKEEAERSDCATRVQRELNKFLFDGGIIPKIMPQQHEILSGLIENSTTVISILSELKV